MTNTAPLSDITVLSLEHAIAAPLCTRQLADLGARVIKVERREGGDFARRYDDRVKGLSSHFVWTNRGKESLTLDLKHAAAADILDRLLPTVDVLVQNLAPKAAARMGLSFEKLSKQYPQLIVCNISGYGDAGPYSQKKAYDLLVQAEAGFLSVTGTKEQVVKSGISIADIAAGTQAHAAILAALIQRAKTAKGAKIDISMLEAMVEWMGFPLFYAYGGAQPPPRSGADHASIYPYGAFATGDDKVIMLGLQNEREWLVFCEKVLNDTSLVDDPRFASNLARSDNRAALQAIVQARFAQSSAQQLESLLDEAGIAAANVNDMESVWQHPQLQALERLVEVDTPKGPVKGFKPPGNSSSFSFAPRPVPDLGEHTKSILSSLGYAAEQIRALQNQGVV